MAFPATYNIQYYQGDTYQFVIRPKSSNGNVFPVDSETYNAYFRIATTRGGADGTGLASGLISITSDNSVTCTITPAIGNNLNANTTYYYDVSIASKTDSNIIYTLLTGTINITADIASAP